MTKNLCIYHSHCADGFGAALAVKKYFDIKGELCEFLPASYGDAPPNVEGLNVLIVDFSYKRDILLMMHDQANTLCVIDHHKTAEDELSGLNFCHFDMTQSGAMLTWKFLNPYAEIPALIKYIQDRDLWQWQLNGSKEISAGLSLLPKDFVFWEPLLNDREMPELYEKGKTVLAYQQQVINIATSHPVRTVELMGFTVPIMNCTTLVSEICGELAKGYPFAITYFDSPDARVYSLRVRDGDVDVSAIARQFGGGGHPAASGFSIPLTKPQL